MIVKDVGKLVILAVVAIGLVVGLLIGTFDDARPAWGALGLILGYLTGNGAAAVRHEPQSPAIGRKDDEITNG